MTAGLDSLGGMELRRALADTLGLDLPQTLLYDFQSIAAITAHLNSIIEDTRPIAPKRNLDEGSLPTAPAMNRAEGSAAAVAVQNVADGSVQSVGQAAAYWDDRQAGDGAMTDRGQQAGRKAALQQSAAQPSNLLKTLR